ncbi:hypothetical protein U8527_16020 [Kordia algicida OT-1]|uniref:Uncharacterized protein n=1 Tax=Kordia algicida OT-1 TaxID=391587 RepID=A9E475_9FLAO|nr:hypothetical protein [Kordia algicida]EDP95328.1 hypothetical protein KAOT1_09656 [Kordia algicida OT-1]
MGWKTSMVLIENRYGFNDETALLKALGKANYEFDKEVLFEECLYPNDESINIGYHNNTLIICDDYQITQHAIELSDGLNLSPPETALVSIFPHAEILSVSCHSVSNFHGYALIRRGLKTRLKMAVDGECIAHGEPFQEELEIYKNSYEEDGIRYWKDENYPDEPFTEDAYMEDFTFGVAKRLLGVNLDTVEGFELMQHVKFKKYKDPNAKPKELPNFAMRTLEEEEKHNKRTKWLKYLLYALLFLAIAYAKSCLRNS